MTATPSTRLSALLPYIIPKAKHCPQPYAEMMARLAAIEFCERTRCWRHVITMSLDANHMLTVTPFYATIFEFEEVTHNGQPLTPTQFTDIPADELLATASLGAPQYVAQIAPGEIAVYPHQPGTLRVSCFLKPRHGQLLNTDPADPLFDAYNVIPDFMLAQFAETLMHGALWRILSTEDEPFSNPDMAAAYKVLFDQACSRHFSSNMRGQQRAPIRVKPRFM